MSAISSNTKRFLFAAKQAELKTLEQLSSNCHLVTIVCNLIHELQKERGVSNVYLASIGEHYPQRRLKQLENTHRAQECLLDLLNQRYLEQKQNTDNHRLLFGITRSLQSLDEIDLLRSSVTNHKISPRESTEAYSELINCFMNIVYEAADISSDAELTKSLVALFNFIQAKEYAGQERAWGAIGFAKTRFTHQICDKLLSLQISQTKSIEVFAQYSNNQHKKAWNTLTAHTVSNELAKFRQLIEQLRCGESVSAEISEVWYELVTQRIDQMHVIEISLCQFLMSVSEQQIINSRQNLKNYESLTGATISFDSSDGAMLGGSMLGRSLQTISSKSSDKNKGAFEDHHLQKSLYDLLLKQAQRIDEMSNELEAAKLSLSEQKLISRAKLLLIEQLKLSEAQAHKKMQKAAMGQGISLAQLAKSIVEASKAKDLSTLSE